MKTKILTASLLALGIAAAAPAQHVSIGFGPDGVRLHAEIGCTPRRPPPPVTGHWELRRERVWIEGCEHIEHVPALYEWRRDRCGRMIRVCVQPAYDRIVREPGRWEWREQRVWVPHDRWTRSPERRQYH